MLSLLRSVSYFPILKWKAGERMALATLKAPLRTSLTPVFLMPPAGDFDHEKQRPLSPLEHIRFFGKRLYDAWGRSLVFVDGIAIDDERHRAGLPVHPLTELLGRAHAAKAQVCPSTTMRYSIEYQDAVRRFATHYSHLPIAIRVNPLDDMESDDFAADLTMLLGRLNCSSERVVLILDFALLGVLKPEEVEAFAETVTERIYHSLELGPWLKVVAAFTSFPTVLKMKPNSAALFPRTDWAVYRRLITQEPALAAKVAFGDYAIDSAPFRKPSGPVPPSAQLRFTTPSDYMVLKGVQARKPVGYAAIYPVAEALVKRHEFAGAAFCDGDEFVGRLAARDPRFGPGSAPTWRWAGTDHHFARVFADLAVLAGVQELDEKAPGPQETQYSLF